MRLGEIGREAGRRAKMPFRLLQAIEIGAGIAKVEPCRRVRRIAGDGIPQYGHRVFRLAERVQRRAAQERGFRVARLDAQQAIHCL